MVKLMHFSTDEGLLPAVKKVINAVLSCRSVYWAFFFYSLSRAFESVDVAGQLALFQQVCSLTMQIGALCILIPRSLNRLIFSTSAVIKVAFFGVAILAVVTAYTGGSYSLLWLLLFCFASEGVEIYRIARIALLCCLLTIVCGILAAFVQTNAGVFVRSNGGIRVALGFTHPNRFGQAILGLYLALCSIRFEQLSAVEALIGIALAAICWFVIGSRTACLGIVVALLCFYAAHVIIARANMRQFYRMVVATVLFSAVVSVILVLIYYPDNELLVFLNKFLSNRLAYPHELINKVGIGLFGFDLNNSAQYIIDQYAIVGSSVPIDNAYINLLITFGPIALTGYCLLMLRSALGALRDDIGIVMAGVLACALIAWSETYVIDVSFNYFILPALAKIYSGQPLFSDITKGHSVPGEGGHRSKGALG